LGAGAISGEVRTGRARFSRHLADENERIPRTAPNTMHYDATIEDPQVFQRPWTVRIELELHAEPNFQLIEHECERDAKGGYRHPPQFLK
jgi:hypothetical protein